ncbi:MAG: carotenoid oxygenase family protein [Steroidobacteraceae bacterium]
MSKYPNTIQFTGLNRPVQLEVSRPNLEVEGVIPPEVQGAFFRAVPDPANAPLFEDEIALSGDGMVSRFLFTNSKVDYDIRYVRTARYEAEKKAGRSLFGKYRNPYTDLPEAKGIDRTVANTTPIWHGGRLLMTKEDGRAYQVDPHSLETVGSFDFNGKLRSPTMTAHPRVDPVTGELFFFGYEAGGLCTTDVAYCIADADGNLTSEQWFKAPYCASIHDFCITEKYAIFPIYPTTSDLDRLKAGGAHWAHQQDLESWVGIMPRYGSVDQMRWFKGPKGVSAFHMTNAFDDGDVVHMDQCLTDTNAFPFMREAGGIQRNQWELQGGLTRWSFDMSKPGDSFGISMVGPPGDLPRLRDADQGRPYDVVWLPSMNPQAKGPPLSGGPVGTTFNALLRVEMNTGKVDMLGLDPGMAINEPVHVPASTAGRSGYLIFTVDRAAGDDFTSELLIVDADNITAPPVARVKVPVPMRPQVHGWWVSAAQLARAK